ncbi:hypothetical protein [uncultured Alsobacter sp.]|uniref:T4SS efffector SepA family protein n=1 Tax=uncultured Alsobacter sp. TaxID=1748258 RepID=UPI0025F7F047|nr:hypothetical protein [uncultured Alsobacter sp.]
MTPGTDLSATTLKRLAVYAEPFVDTVDSVVNRILDHYEAAQNATAAQPDAMPGVPLVSAASPPNLSYTTPKSIEIDGEIMPPAQAYWNLAFLKVVEIAAKKGKTAKELKNMISANSYVGEKVDNGYKFLPEVGLSIQGLDANSAWKATYNLARTMRIKVDVVFAWQNTEKAARPNEVARMTVG